MLTKQELIDFEEDIIREFEVGNIRAPVHLQSNNEDQLIKIFSDYKIGSQDWVMCTWRSHYECLLKGVPVAELKQAILDKRSITACFKKYKVLSSAIVGGICPIALGVALSLKRKQESERVFCFIGDMSAETGVFHECYKYGLNFDLPIWWVVGDNNKSVCTNTRKVWGVDKFFGCKGMSSGMSEGPNIIRYKYESKYPHCGHGKRINF